MTHDPGPVEPAYLMRLSPTALAARVEEAKARLKSCDLCPRRCAVDRTESLKGCACRTGAEARVSSYGAHHGEEDPLRGRFGSGTIFFTRCNLRCAYCQNWDISQTDAGHPLTTEELAGLMLALQAQGCHNINLVSPSHVVAQILDAVALASKAGLRLPLVYNTGGYDCPEALALLEDVVDIYMPDMKYGDSVIARRYSKVRDYVEVNRAAVAEMHRQVGDLSLDRHGIARRGLLVRHLVLPEGMAGTEAVFRFLAEEVSPDTYLNILGQYRPCHKAGDHPKLARRPDSEEMSEAYDLARRCGLWRLDGENHDGPV